MSDKLVSTSEEIEGVSLDELVPSFEDGVTRLPVDPVLALILENELRQEPTAKGSVLSIGNVNTGAITIGTKEILTIVTGNMAVFSGSKPIRTLDISDVDFTASSGNFKTSTGAVALDAVKSRDVEPKRWAFGAGPFSSKAETVTLPPPGDKKLNVLDLEVIEPIIDDLNKEIMLDTVDPATPLSQAIDPTWTGNHTMKVQDASSMTIAWTANLTGTEKPE